MMIRRTPSFSKAFRWHPSFRTESFLYHTFGRDCLRDQLRISLNINEETIRKWNTGFNLNSAQLVVNVPKFQRTSKLPSSLGNFSFMNEYTSRASAPFTSLFSKKTSLLDMSASYCLTNSIISSWVPGSCPPNWLQGKAKTSKPRAPYSS